MHIFRVVSCVALSVLLSSVASARTWRPSDRPAFAGEYVNVVGDNVLIRSDTGMVRIPYAKLGSTDKALVRARLSAANRGSEIARLEGRSTDEPSDSGTVPPTGEGLPLPGGNGDDSSRTRVWTDINGQTLMAEFVNVAGDNVILRSDGRLHTFPISGFSAGDQQWIREQSGAGGQGQPAVPGSIQPPNNPGSMPMPGFPGAGPGGLPGAMPGFPGGTGISGGHGAGLPGAPGIGGGHGAGAGLAGTPGFSGGHGAGVPAMPSMPELPGNQGIGSPGMPNTPGFSGGHDAGMAGAGGPGGGMGIPGGGSPNLHGPATSFAPPEIEPPDFQTPEIPNPGSMFEYVFKCDTCGAEFDENSGVKAGDECPNCSRGSSFNFRGARGLVKIVIFLGVLMVSGVGWVIKKISSS